MSQQSLKVLIVDYITERGTKLATYLNQEHSYEVDIVENEKDLLTLLEQVQGKYDVVLLDDVLVPLIGRERESFGARLTKEIKSHYSDIEVIVLVQSGMESGLGALRAGAYRYLPKWTNEKHEQINRAEIAMLIKTAVEHRQLKIDIWKKQQAADAAERQAYQLEALHKINVHISSALNLAGVLTVTLKEGLKAIRTASGSIMLVNPIIDELEVKARVIHGEFVVDRLDPHLALKEGIAGYVAATGRPYNCPDISKDSRYKGVVNESHLRSILSVPIISHDRVLGTINADNQESNFFNENDLQFLSALADRVGLAIESQRMRDIETILSSLTLDEMLAKIVESACILTGTASGTIILMDAESGTTIRAIKFSASGHEEFTPRKEGLMRLVAKSGEPIEIPDAQYDPRVKQSTKSSGVKSIIGVPLKVRVERQDTSGVRTIGAIFVNSIQKRKFSQRDWELLQSLANQVAIVIENARLYEEVAKERDRSKWMTSQLLTLHEITQMMQAELDLESLLNLISRLVAELFKVETGGILLLDEEKQYLTFAGAHGLSQRIVEATRLKMGQSISGRVVASGQPLIVPDYPNNPHFENPAAEDEGILAIISTPLWIRGEVIGTLQAHSKSDRYAFGEDDLRILSIMATHAASAIQNAKLFEQTRRRAQALEALHQTALEITSYRQVPGLIRSILERASELLHAKGARLYKLDETGRQVELIEASRGLEHFVGLIKFEVGDSVVGQVIKTKKPVFQNDYRNWPHRIRVYDPYNFTAVIAAPITWQGKIWGAISIHDDKEGRTFTEEEDGKLTLNFANLATVALEGAEAFRATEIAQERLRSFYKASNAVVSSQNSEAVLQDIVERACAAANATSGHVLLIDAMGQARTLITTNSGKSSNTERIVRPDGFSMQVMRRGERQVIPDVNQQREQVNPWLLQNGIAAAVCLPLSLQGGRIGVMWVYYDRPRQFSEAEIEALQLYVNQAAIAYDNARRIEELEHLRQAAQALSGAAGLSNVLKQIVRSARRVLQADSTSIFVYDSSRNEFTRHGSLSSGIPTGVFSQFCEEKPWQVESNRVIEEGWIGVEDVSNEQQNKFLEVSLRRILWQVGIQSFQGVALTMGEEPLGVLYMNYRRPRNFSQEEQRTAQTFANHAAVAMNRAKLSDQVSKAHHAASTVAEVTVLGDLQSTLASIAKEIQNILGCDVVTIWPYNPDRNVFDFPPAMEGVDYPEKILELGGVPKDAVVSNILLLNDLHIAEDRMADPLLRGPFTERERVISSVGVPLITKNYKVGVMIVSYRHGHHFTDNELNNIKLFAHQAALAIRNAQLYERVQKRARALQALYQASQAVTRSLDLEEILSAIVEQALKLTETSRYSHLSLVEGDKLKLETAYPPEDYPGLQKTIANINLRHGQPIGVTGRVVKSGQSQLVGDVTQDRDYIPYIPEIRSELAVPIKVGEQVIGVINVEHPDYNAFNQEDQQVLEALAVQAAVAIQKAKLYEAEQHRVQQMAAIAEISRTINTSLDLNTTLNTILLLIKPLIDYTAAEISLWDEDKQAMVVRGQAGDPRYTKQANSIYALNEGFTGWIVEHRQPLFIEDTGRYLDMRPKVIDPDKPIRSFAGVPLLVDDSCFGTLELASDSPQAFDEDDKGLLIVIGQHATAAIYKAKLYEAQQRQYQELEQMKGRLAARTAVAWMGMTSATWQHSINNNTRTIKDWVKLLYNDLAAGATIDKLKERLTQIERVLEKIKYRQIAVPLSADEGIESININDLLGEWINQIWWDQEPYALVKERELKLTSQRPPIVRANARWLKLALDRLVENAVKAMMVSPTKKLTIVIQVVDDKVQIIISDTGVGIPAKVQPRLLKEVIKESESSGIGLLLAQMILQVYGGDIEVKSGPVGTTVVVWLPLATNNNHELL